MLEKKYPYGDLGCLVRILESKNHVFAFLPPCNERPILSSIGNLTFLLKVSSETDHFSKSYYTPGCGLSSIFCGSKVVKTMGVEKKTPSHCGVKKTKTWFYPKTEFTKIWIMVTEA